MSKRILTEIGSTYAAKHDALINVNTNWDLIRVYGARIRRLYAVIIADDNKFEGL